MNWHRHAAVHVSCRKVKQLRRREAMRTQQGYRFSLLQMLFPSLLLPQEAHPHLGMSTPAASQAWMTVKDLGTVMGCPSTKTSAVSLGGGGGGGGGLAACVAAGPAAVLKARETGSI
eukprot:scaffold62287_cov21-Tisochrysis_lutea.AAC.1